MSATFFVEDQVTPDSPSVHLSNVNTNRLLAFLGYPVSDPVVGRLDAVELKHRCEAALDKSYTDDDTVEYLRHRTRQLMEVAEQAITESRQVVYA